MYHQTTCSATTNLQDDPGRSWIFVRSGRKQIENMQDHSKTSISVMWCGSASADSPDMESAFCQWLFIKPKTFMNHGWKVGWKAAFKTWLV